MWREWSSTTSWRDVVGDPVPSPSQSADGFLCKGCGTYTVESLPPTSSIDMTSIDPADINIVLDEITSRTLGGR